MKPASAAAFVNDQVIFWPGWEFVATDYSWFFEDDTVKIDVYYRPHETNRQDARDNDLHDIPTPVLYLGPVPFPVHVDGLDEFGLLYELGKIVLEIQEHEMREALRVRRLDYDAPFHPHKIAGNRTWEEKRNGDLSRVQAVS
jgi:hypothetical protein